MRIIDRLFILIFAVIFIVFSLGMIGASLGLVELKYLTDYLLVIDDSIELGIIGVVFFLMSIRILQLFFRKKTIKRAVIADNKLGTIKVTLEAINELVKKVVNQELDIKDIESKIKTIDNGIHIYLNLVVSPQSNIPDLTNKVQNMVKEKISTATGVNITKVEILVKQIEQQQELRVE